MYDIRSAVVIDFIFPLFTDLQYPDPEVNSASRIKAALDRHRYLTLDF